MSARILELVGDQSCRGFRANLDNRDSDCRAIFFTITPLLDKGVEGIPKIELCCDVTKFDEYYQSALQSGVGVRVTIQRTASRNDTRTKTIYDLYPDIDELEPDGEPRVIRMSARQMGQGMGQAPDVDLRLLEQKYQFENKIERQNQTIEDLKREYQIYENAHEEFVKAHEAIVKEYEKDASVREARIEELEKMVAAYVRMVDDEDRQQSKRGLLGIPSETISSAIITGLASYARTRDFNQTLDAVAGAFQTGLQGATPKEQPPQDRPDPY